MFDGIIEPSSQECHKLEMSKPGVGGETVSFVALSALISIINPAKD